MVWVCEGFERRGGFNSGCVCMCLYVSVCNLFIVHVGSAAPVDFYHLITVTYFFVSDFLSVTHTQKTRHWYTDQILTVQRMKKTYSECY